MARAVPGSDRGPFLAGRARAQFHRLAAIYGADALGGAVERIPAGVHKVPAFLDAVAVELEGGPAEPVPTVPEPTREDVRMRRLQLRDRLDVIGAQLATFEQLGDAETVDALVIERESCETELTQLDAEHGAVSQ